MNGPYSLKNGSLKVKVWWRNWCERNAFQFNM